MKITNNTSRVLELGFIPPHGRSIEASGGYIVVSDEYSTHPTIQALKDDESITIDSFSVEDNYSSTNTFRNVSSYEANLFFAGLYNIPDTWETEGTIQASATAAYIQGEEIALVLNTRGRNILQFEVPNYADTIKVFLEEGTLALSAIVTALNEDEVFSQYLEASINDTNHLRITTLALGENADVDVVGSTEYKSAASYLGLSGGTKTAGTKTVATLTLQVLGPTGQGIYGSEQILSLYTAATEGALTEEFVFQAMSPRQGTVVDGNFSNQITVKSGDDGYIVLEIVAPSTIAGECHLDLEVPETHVWAVTPSTRLAVVSS